MKKFQGILLSLFSALLVLAPEAHAFRASHFKGLYEVRSEHGRADKKYVLCDVDTVENIWAKYDGSELPADLIKIKDEPSILLGFTFRTGLFFNLEANALVGDTTLAMPGGSKNTMQLMRKGDGSYELGVRIDSVVTFYDLGPQEPLRGKRNPLPQALHFD